MIKIKINGFSIEAEKSDIMKLIKESDVTNQDSEPIKYGLKKYTHNAWTIQEIEIIIQGLESNLSLGEISKNKLIRERHTKLAIDVMASKIRERKPAQAKQINRHIYPLVVDYKKTLGIV